MDGPNWITIDKVGNLYITDGGNNRIRKVDTFGNITTFAGNGTHTFSEDGSQVTAASFAGLQEVCTDTFGNVFIVRNAEGKPNKPSYYYEKVTRPIKPENQNINNTTLSDNKGNKDNK